MYFSIKGLRLIHKIREISDIVEAKNFLNEFGKVFPTLYGKESQTFTLHTLVKHLHQDANGMVL